MKEIADYLLALKSTLDRLSMAEIDRAIETLHQARLTRNRVFIMGNGGSASTASHFTCDLAKNTRAEGWPHFRVYGLTDNMALFSAFANDEGYAKVFAQQLDPLLHEKDIVIGISASGNSPNVLEATRLATARGATTIGFTGFDGGGLAKLVDINVHVASDCIERVEDIHLVLEHLMCTVLRQRVSGQVAAAVPLAAESRVMRHGTDGSAAV